MNTRMLKTGSLMLGGLLIASADMAKQMIVLFIAIDDLRPEIGCCGNDEYVEP